MTPNKEDDMLHFLQDFQREHGLAEVFCPEKPEKLINTPIGMYHCPGCGVMVVAGLPHPEIVLMDNGEFGYNYL